MAAAARATAVLLGLLSVGALASQGGAGGKAAAQGEALVGTPETEVKKYVSPVKRVVNLLEKMKAELDAEAAKEAEMYDKMVCWCETSEKEKTKAVADAEAKDKELSAEIEGRSARFGELSAEIAKTKEEIAANTETLKKATAIREKEAAEFKGEEKDLVQAVTNLRNAIAVLSKHQGSSLLQMDGPVLSGMRVLLRDVALEYEERVAGNAERRGRGARAPPTALVALAAETRRLEDSDAQGVALALLRALDVHGAPVADVLPAQFAARVVARAARPAKASPSSPGAFLQAGDKQPLYESRSSARSSQIYGIMNQMLEEFESELSTAQKEELKAQEDYKALAAAKTEEIDVGKKKLDEMQVEDAGNQKALSDAKEDLSLTREQRSADVEFLQNLRLTCNDLDSQWEKRSKTRAAETTAVAEAITILTEDDNREMLHKSVALLQTRAAESASASAQRRDAAAVLRRAAQTPDFQADDLLAAWHGRHGGAPRFGAAAGPRAQLSTLAVAVQLDSFTKVKKMMDTMLAELKEQQAEEVKFKAYCEKELDTNEKTVFEKTELKKDLEAEIAQLEALVEKLEGEIGAARKEIAATELEIKEASQTREAENGEFQATVADQRATQSILKKALAKLKDFYEKGIGRAVLAQRAAQEPPVKFSAYKTSSGASPVIGLIEQILEDSAALEAEATAGEFKAQADYETFVKDSNGLIKSLQEAVTAKTKAIAAAKTDTAEAAASLEDTEGELDSLAAYKADLHGQCDFVLKNFDIRQRARMQEMEAIQAAKSILSGAGAK